MTISTELALIINGIILLISIITALRMAYASIMYTRAIGDFKAQEKQKGIILRSIIFLIFLGLSASALNLVFV